MERRVSQHTVLSSRCCPKLLQTDEPSPHRRPAIRRGDRLKTPRATAALPYPRDTHGSGYRKGRLVCHRETSQALPSCSRSEEHDSDRAEAKSRLPRSLSQAHELTPDRGIRQRATPQCLRNTRWNLQVPAAATRG